MQLSFDIPRLMNDIIKELNVEMDRVSQVLVQYMIDEIDMMPSYNDSFSQWKLDVADTLKWRAMASAGQLVREVGILDQSESSIYKAMAVEFGTGTRMSSSSVNPWLGDYLASEYYHDSRNGTGIYSLPGEKVYDPDSDSWADSNATSRKALPFLEETGALYWTNVFGNSATKAQIDFDKGIDNAIERIDFSKYLIMK